MSVILVFDYDGVIVDSLELFMKFFLQACIDLNVEGIKTRDDFLRLFEDNMYSSLMGEGLSPGEIEVVISKVKNNLLANHHRMKVFPGMRKVLYSLSKRYTLFLITSNDSEVVKDFLVLNHLDLFAGIHGCETSSSKVDKIKLIKNLTNEECYYIGDTIGDIIEGKRAGALTVAVGWGWHPMNRLLKASPDYLAYTPKDLLKIFKQLP